MPTDTPPGGTPAGAAAAALLDGLGIAPVCDIDTASAAVARFAVRRGHHGLTALGLSHGVLHVAAPPLTLPLLRYDLDVLTDEVRRDVPAVRRVRLCPHQTSG